MILHFSNSRCGAGRLFAARRAGGGPTALAASEPSAAFGIGAARIALRERRLTDASTAEARTLAKLNIGVAGLAGGELYAGAVAASALDAGERWRTGLTRRRQGHTNGVDAGEERDAAAHRTRLPGPGRGDAGPVDTATAGRTGSGPIAGLAGGRTDRADPVSADLVSRA